MFNSITEEENPIALYIELTDQCNLNCSMCRSFLGKSNVLGLDLFQNIAQNLFSNACFVDLRGWGESTLLPNFLDYLEIAKQYPLRKKIISNGTISKPQLWEKLAEAGVTVGFSVDAATDKLFRKLRGNASLDEVVCNIKRFTSALNANGYNSRDYTYFCISVSGQNINTLNEIVRLGMELNIRRFKFDPVFLEANHPDLLIYHRSAVKESISKLRALRINGNLQLELSASLLPELVNKSAINKLCIHPFKYVYINASGRIGFCDHLNGQVEYTFGHWNDGFENIWNGAKMKKLREEHYERFFSGTRISICSECNWCYNYRYMDLEDWVNPIWDNYRVSL